MIKQTGEELTGWLSATSDVLLTHLLPSGISFVPSVYPCTCLHLECVRVFNIIHLALFTKSFITIKLNATVSRSLALHVKFR